VILAVVASQASASILPHKLHQQPNSRFVETLSDRELEILRYMATGATNQAIADQLFITVGTVKSHINHILGKLEARNRTEAVARARESGLFEG
jgi:LuxR family maltose regulon positive regulatory protein